MATLEKIRSKSVFLIVVIGVALLAFIIGDALTNSRNLFGDHTTVAKVGKTKIDFTDYQRKREELNNEYEKARAQNPGQFANFDTQVLPQMALDQLVQETLITNAAERAGIASSPNLLRYYMLEMNGNRKVQELMQSLQASGLPASTPQQAYDIIFNPKRNGLTDKDVQPLQNAWIAAEKETEKMIKQQTYARLLQNTVKANDLDKKALYDDYVATAEVEVAFLPFGQLDAKEYPVSDSEINTLYAKEKERFRVGEPTKEVSFIAVSVGPSEQDIKDAYELSKATVEYMSTHPGALSKELKKDGVQLQKYSKRASDLPVGPVKDYVLRAPKDSVSRVNNDIHGFTVVRMGSKTNAVDSVQISVISISGESLGKKVLAAVNSGMPIDSVTSKYGADSIAVQAAQWFPLYTADGPTNALQKDQLDSLRNAGGKYVTLVSSPQGMAIAKLDKENAPVTIYDYEEATYVLGPSSKTLIDERDRLEKFLAENNDAKKFSENATNSGYNVQKFALTQSEPAIPRFAGMNQYYPDSRQVVRWVMIDGKQGEVSHIYESKSPTNPMLYAVAVDEAYEEYAPATSADVKDMLTQKIRSDKAGDKLVEKYKKNTQSVQSAAQAMGVTPNTMQQFRFGQNPGINDPAIVGKIAGAKADKKVVIVKGGDGVYVYQVINKSNEKFPYNEELYDQQYMQFINPNLMDMIKGNSKYKNTIYKFEGGE